MSKQMGKHHKKAARHERAVRHVKRVRGRKPTRLKKPVTRGEQVTGVAAAERQGPEAHVGEAIEQSSGGLSGTRHSHG